jgi:aspartyl-tRNA(Asn)/glutamyl-tRNA(Gln) amidotransferase subunit C
MTTAVDADRVRAIARLARLTLDGAEVESLGRDLAAIVAYVGVLDELDLADVPPTAHPFLDAMPLRPDAAHTPAGFAVLGANAPDPHDGYFRVPRILGGDDE